MPRVVAAAGVIIFAAAVWPITSAARPIQTVTIYDPNPQHIWNRLYSALLVRQDAKGAVFGASDLDPGPLLFSRHLLEPQSHRDAIRVLDEFLRNHGENLIHDPLKRAIFIRDLWPVFDWAVLRVPMKDGDPTYEPERRELQVRLAEILRRLALTRQEIAALPDNYAQSVNLGAFPKEYDPACPYRAFLPPDLFDQHGPWVQIQRNERPVAEQHVSYFAGRSRFLVFIRLPGGRKATYDYLRTLWESNRPLVASTDPTSPQPGFNLQLPTFPSGTQVALVRQMTLFDDRGSLRPAPITESIQIRLYRSIAPISSPPGDRNEFNESRGQQFYEIRLDRGLLLSGKNAGLREILRDEKERFLFNGIPFDELDEPKAKINWTAITPILQECSMCPHAPGIHSVNSRAVLLKPNPMQHEPGGELPARWWEQDGTLLWKADRTEWIALRKYWEQAQPNRTQESNR